MMWYNDASIAWAAVADDIDGVVLLFRWRPYLPYIEYSVNAGLQWDTIEVPPHRAMEMRSDAAFTAFEVLKDELDKYLSKHVTVEDAMRWYETVMDGQRSDAMAMPVPD